MDDELQEVRDNFYVGNFAKAVSLCEQTMTSDLTQSENDAILARCYLALGMIEKLKPMQHSENPGQKATALLAVITKSPKEQVKASAKDCLLKLAKDDVTCAMLSAIAQAIDGSYTEAVQLAQAHPTVEVQALCVFFCLICNQVNMAEKMLNGMAGTNDDSVAFRLAKAAVKLATGDPEEAYLTYCDLSGQFPPAEGEEGGFGSVLLQTGKAVANMQRSMFVEAVEDLQRALAQAPNDVDVLVNLCCCMSNLRKKDEFQQYYAKLVQVAPTHPYVAKSEGLTQAFGRFKASVVAS
eukprot:CAMPEP_0117532818 /NCGR_PEP_ID=MMETSP0784-20121206/39564_1 /TAXON_ID=39447 /ORGANISM="" /LENGTH=294 /DNA_ID=CAMNT_0005329223 /DNA_START=53 /DNA_END=937 /DNA_ORIENTATION=+